ncbi:MAG: hypothetical protein HQL21_04900 [Candidatus Omnitrophica bacterium]|nr:hypothetical protein [Candidatus Omnitrophota bacterium]
MIIKWMLLRGTAYRQGLTLTEVLIGVCIFAISIAGISGTMRQGHKMIAEAQAKKVAYSNAQSLLEKYLTNSYSGMVALAGTHAEAGIGSGAACLVTVAQQTMPPEPIAPPAGKSRIPYCSIEVVCEYGTQEPKQKVSLSGIVPYPYLQVYTATQAALGAEAQLADAQIFEYKFTPIVRSDLMIFYDIAIKVEDNTIPINGFDLVITQALLNGVPVGIATGTPIMTQPALSNAIGVSYDKVNVGVENVVTINWHKTSNGGKVTSKKVNMVIVRTENNR